MPASALSVLEQEVKPRKIEWRLAIVAAGLASLALIFSRVVTKVWPKRGNGAPPMAELNRGHDFASL